MAKIVWRTKLDKELFRKHQVFKGSRALILGYPEEAERRILDALSKIAAKDNERALTGHDPVELDVTIEVHYNRRSINQNNLWRALMEYCAKVRNRDLTTKDKWTAKGMHEYYMEQYAIKHEHPIKESELSIYREAFSAEGFRFIGSRPSKPGWVMCTVWETTGRWTVKYMSECMHAVLVDLEHAGAIRDADGDLDAIFKDLEKLESQQCKK